MFTPSRRHWKASGAVPLALTVSVADPPTVTAAPAGCAVIAGACAGTGRTTGLRITTLLVPGPFELDHPERWEARRDRAGLIMDTALALRPELVVFTTGPAGQLPWERAADAFEEVAARYADAGVTDLVVHMPRPTDPYRGDPAVFERIFSD